MERRTFLRRGGVAITGLSATAGCVDMSTSSEDESSSQSEQTETEQSEQTGTAGGPDQTLTVATYGSFTGEGTAGNYLKQAFESERDGVTVEFETPENGVNDFIQRKSQGAPIEADLYVGLNTGELVRTDEQLDDALFATAAESVSGSDGVKPGLEFDPDGRVVPYDTGYISLVYDEDAVAEPATFDTLLEPEYEGALLAQNAQQSDPGRAFLLWSIQNKGPDNYLDYWSDLSANGVRILSDWQPSYQAYLNEEAPMVVSYSTDQVFYNGEDVDMSRHQVGFLNDQGYANPEGMAQFVDSDTPELAQEFMAFMLNEQSQIAIAERNVQFPAVQGVEPGGTFGEFALEPPNPVTYGYDELVGNVSTWVDDWARQIVSD